MIPALFPLVASILFTNLFKPSDASYVVSIMPSSKECFQFHTPKGVSSLSSISGSFEVLHDDVDSEEVTVRVFNVETGDNLYEVPSGEQEGDFEFEDLQSDSMYKICFQNNAQGHHEDDAFDMGFNLRFHDPPRTLEQEESGPDNERATKLVEKASRIHSDWDTLQDHFDFLRNREAIHEDMNYEIVSKLTKWTYIEAVVVIGMAVLQTMYWKKFFEKRRLAIYIVQTVTLMLTQDLMWILEAVMHAHYLIILVEVSILWRPNSHAKDNAMQMELPALGSHDNELELAFVDPSADDMGYNDGNGPDHQNGIQVDNAVLG